MATANTPGGTDIDDAVLAELRDHETWHGPHLIRGIERHHPEAHPGIPLSLFEAYARELGYDVDQSREDVEAKTVDDTDWQSDKVYYRVGEAGANVSAYPASWHEAYEDRGLRGLLVVMRKQLRRDVTRGELLLALESIAGMTRQQADTLLTEARKRQVVVVQPRTNPEAFVYPAKKKRKK